MSAPVWKYACGYVMIRVEGRGAPRFINDCAAMGVGLADIASSGENSFTASVPASRFKKLRPLARRARVRVRILDKKGLPFTGYSFLRRPMLPIGAVACAVALAAASGYIWEIRVEGCVEVREQDVLAILEANSVKPLMKKSELDMTAVENALELSDADIAWAGARLNGSRLTMGIVESRTFEKSGADVPCDIVASCDAIVDKLTVLRGRAAVKEGQIVKAGDVLISGILEANENAPARYVKAQGSATGRLFYMGQSYVKRLETKLLPSGRAEEAQVVKLCGQYVSSPSEFAQYETEELATTGFENLFLPMSAVTELRRELAPIQTKLSDSELLELAGSRAQETARSRVDKSAEIINEQLDTNVEEGGAEARYVIEVRQNIGRVRLIDAPEEIYGEYTPPD